MTRARREYIVLGAIGIIFLILLFNAVLTARTAVRDDLRRADITNLKRAAEMYFNRHNFYPTPPDKSIICTESSDQNSWLFGNASPLLQEQHIDALPHDVRESRGHIYRYCATKIPEEVTNGYFFEAELEIDEPETIAFDEDETRKFYYRVLHEDGKTLYRVCGGIETQCDPES